MRMVLVTVLVVGAMLSGCGSLGPSDGWRVEKVVKLSGFAVPECATVEVETGDVFVSNIVAPAKGADNRYNTDDGTGFVTRLKTGGKLVARRWVDSETNAPLNSI